MVKEATHFIKYVLQAVFPESFVLGRFKGLDGLVLTFDDGPHPEHTPIILKELKKRDVKAIFFVTGSELYNNQDLGKSIIEDGHLIGNHTYDHLSVNNCSFEEYRNSIEKNDVLLDSLIPDFNIKLFRPPYSDFSAHLLLYILFSDYMLLNWTKDSRDSFILSSDGLLEYVRSLRVCNGYILLFHEDSSQTVMAIPEVIDFFQSKGFQFVLPEL